MLRTGLVSATFRGKSAGRIIDLAKMAGLDAIEWSGDIHVPHGDYDIAKQVGCKTREAGLLTPSYASYYRAGQHLLPFETVLNTAVALGAMNIRVWAGEKGSAVSDSDTVHKVYEDLREIVALAGTQGITVSVEYHGNTLTDAPQSAQALLAAVDGLYTYWQPLYDRTVFEELEILEGVEGRLTNIHTYYRKNDAFSPLSEGRGCWTEYIRYLKNLPTDRFLFLEFVKADDTRQFQLDAETLRTWIGGGSK